MRFPDELLKCALFLAVEESGQTVAAGTAFLLGTRDPFCLYLVTARHCVRSAERYARMAVAINTTDGRKAGLWLDRPKWFYPQAEADDIAVMPLNLEEIADPLYDVFPLFIEEYGLTDEKIAMHRVGIGDEVASVGLFVHSTGTERLRPILRTGVVSAMPDEPLQDRGTGLPYFPYLVEMRSIGGLSGSPVFLVLPPGRWVGNDMQPAIRIIYLLGVVRGHLLRVDEGYAEQMRQEAGQLNSGIAIVTPIQRAIDVILHDPELRDMRREHKKAQERWGWISSASGTAISKSANPIAGHAARSPKRKKKKQRRK